MTVPAFLFLVSVLGSRSSARWVDREVVGAAGLAGRGLRRTSCDRPQRGLLLEAKGLLVSGRCHGPDVLGVVAGGSSFETRKAR